LAWNDGKVGDAGREAVRREAVAQAGAACLRTSLDISSGLVDEAESVAS